MGFFSSNWNFHQHSLSIFYIKKGSVMFTNFVIRYLETHPSVFNIMFTIMVYTKGTDIKHVILIFIYYARIIIQKIIVFKAHSNFRRDLQQCGNRRNEMQPFRKQCHKSLHFMLFADFMILLFRYPIVGDVIS